MSQRKPKAKRTTTTRTLASTSKSSPKAGVKAKRASERSDVRRNRDARTSGDWRAKALAEIRRLIREADPDVVEERKWAKASNPLGVPVWSHEGIVCTGETYKQIVKLTFPKGAFLEDPDGLFNSSLEGNTRRAIDIGEGDTLDAKAFKALIKAAVAENRRSGASKSKAGAKANVGAKSAKGAKLLSGGNPQIAMADGDAPVQEYIDAMPGWKHELGKRLDALIVLSVPNVRKAVKWNSPFYGVEGRGWFLSFHCFTKYVKATFFNGTSLHPIPPGGTPKSKDSRWIDIHEGDELDEAQFAAWVKQAAELSGWTP